MADSYIRVPEDSTGKRVDASELTLSAVAVQRQRIVIADDTSATAFAAVMASGPGGAEAALVVRNIPSGTQNVDGLVSITGTVVVSVSTPFTINDISATVLVAVPTPFTLNNISATVLVAGVVNLSATAVVTGAVNISATANVVVGAGTANIGSINNISATVAAGVAYVTEAGTGSLVQVGDSANAAIRVNIVAGAGSGGTAQDDGTSFNAQSSTFTPIGGMVDDSGSSTISENDAGVVRMTTNRAMHAHMRTDGGVNMDDSANSALRVSIVSGAGSGGTAITDSASYNTAGSSFTPIGGYVDDTTPATLGEHAAGAVRMTTNRAFHVNLRHSNGNEITAGAALSVKVENISQTASVILAAGTNNFGTVNDISRTVQVAVATPFTVNNISATVIVAVSTPFTINNISGTPSVILAAGTANFGTLNHISRTVQVAVGTPFTVNNISATVTVAGAVNISATASVVVGAGTANIGSINNISATVTVAGSVTVVNATSTATVIARSGPIAIMSASHGPRCVIVSASAAVELVPSPGAGVSLHITQIMASNGSGTLTGLRIGTSASSNTIIQMMAASGGGFVLNFDPPWKLSASERAICSVNPNAVDCFVTVNYYVE